jgi:hypothetical protein
MFRAPGEDQTRAASSLGTMQNIRRPGHAKSRPQVHRSYMPGQPQARGSGMAVHAPRAAGRSPQRPPARGTATACGAATIPAPRPEGPHDASRPGPPVPANSRKSIYPPRRHPRQRIGTQAPRYPPGTPGSRGTRVPERAPGSAPHAKPEWAPRGPCPWPSVEKPTVRTDRPGGPDALRYTSVDTATYRPAVTHRDTRRDKKETAPRVRFRSQGAIFRRWWQVLGSNQRRLSRRFYSPSLRAESNAGDQRIRRPRRAGGPTPSAIRP